MFWALAPFLLTSLALLPFMIDGWTPSRVIVVAGLELLVLFTLLGFFDPLRFHWAWRAVGALIFIAYVAYLVAELFESGGRITIGRSRGATSVLSAALGFLVFGLPGLWFALFGRLTLRPFREDADGDCEESESE